MSTHSGSDPEFSKVAPRPARRRGLTLVEFLVILGTLVVLVALLLPTVRSSRPAAYRAQCTNNLRQIVLALRAYEQAYGALPPAYTVDASGRPLHSWRTLILPYLEQEPLYRTIDLAKPWNDPANASARDTALLVYHCPTSHGLPNTTTYLALVGPDACFLPDRPRTLSEITDAPDATVMVIEAGEKNAVPWMAPQDADEALFLSLGPMAKLGHGYGWNAGFVDRGTRFLKLSTPASVRRALASISGHDDMVARQW